MHLLLPFLPPSSSPSPWPWGEEAKGRPPLAIAAGGGPWPDRPSHLLRPRLAGRPVRLRGPPCRHGRWWVPLGLLPPKAKRKGRRKGKGISGGKGGPGFHLASPFPRLALPHLWAGPPNFGASVVFTARPAQRSEKTIGAT
jgi:hypothetical protein